KQGVTDVVRISDARMSGTSYGAVVLHVAPESAVGGAPAPGGGRGRVPGGARGSSRKATGAGWTSRGVPSTCSWTTPSSSGGVGPGHRRRGRTSAATGGLFGDTGCPRTGAWGSHFSPRR